MKKRRFLFPLAVAVSVLTGVTAAVRLAAYHVPGPLLVVYAVLTTSAIGTSIRFFAERLATTVHRCSADGCTFQVQERGVDAGESAYWREVAAAHPRHDLNR
ncbi:hypothetical protein ACFV3R_15025 [Streptomyces sp. NPDC059740]|uniref:hypothetical protein n=1 Tax=Streptomyces sp. NPDC059740 TaxID=3346926 RepID=UPI0036542B23